MRYEYKSRNTLGSYPADPLSVWRIIGPLLSLVIISIVALIALKSLLTEQEFYKRGVAASATVTDVKTEKVTSSSAKSKKKEKTVWTTTLEFRDQSGKLVVNTMNLRASVGEQIGIVFDPQNPNEVRLASSRDNFKTVFISVCVIFAILILTSLIFLVRNIFRRRAVLRLFKVGEEIQATIFDVNTRVHSRTSYKRYSFFNYHSYKRSTAESQVIAQWTNPRDNQEYRFASVGVSGELTREVVGQKANILIDPNDPSSYYFGPASLHGII